MNIMKKDNLSYISKKNEINEQIKDIVIDRFQRIIYKQYNEILLLKRKLEDTIKNSLLIIKKYFLKKKLSPVNQISLSYISNDKQNTFYYNNNNKQQKDQLNTLGISMNNLELYKKNHICKKNAKSFISFNSLNLKKFFNSKKKPSNKKYKISYINNNNKLSNYSELLNGTRTNRNSRNNNNNSSNKEFIVTDKNMNMNNTFFAENNKIIDPIVQYNKKRYIIMKDLDNKSEDRKSKSKDNTIYHQNSFFAEKHINRIKNLTLHSIKGKNKIRLINGKLNRIKQNQTNTLNSFKKLNLSNNVINSNNLINKIYDYSSSSEKTYKIKSNNKNIITMQKDIINNMKNNNNIKDIYKAINKNSFYKNKKNLSLKLNKVILKIKDVNNNTYATENRITSQKTIKKISISGMNKMNTINYFSMTDRLKIKNGGNKSVKNDNIIKNINYQIDVNNNFCDDQSKSSNIENSYQTIYNPTFSSFLNRK